MDQEYPKITPSLSKSLGIEVIYQEFNLVPALSVAENIYLCEKTENSILFSAKEIEKKAAEVLDKFGVNIDPQCRCRIYPLPNNRSLKLQRQYPKM